MACSDGLRAILVLCGDIVRGQGFANAVWRFELSNQRYRRITRLWRSERYRPRT
jgi:hypothetical protein